MSESFLICLFTFILGVALIELLLPWFNSFTGKQIVWNQLFDLRTILVLVSAMMLTSLLGGFYPSVMAGRFSPAAILKGDGQGNRTFGFRKSVIVFQFVISMILIAGSVVISSQVKHMLTKDLGLNTDQVIVLPMHGDPQLLSKLPVFFDRLSQVPSVTSSSVCELIPGETVYGIIGKFEGHENLNYSTIGVGFNYLNTFQMDLLAGRDFSRNQPLDTLVDRVMINETLAQNLGWTAEEAIGKSYDQGGDGEHPGEIIGVLKDFNFGSLKTDVNPMVLAYLPYFFDKAAIRIEGPDMKASIEQIQQTWASVYSSRPFDFRFADDSIQMQYQSEKKFGRLFSYFSTLAILIGVLGLFGMVSLDLTLRTKEVGIRKVLGASMRNLITLLSRDFLNLVLIAFVVSVPLSYWLSQQWLANFAYRLTSIELLITLPSLGVLLMALAAVCLQTIKSARANPVESLRSE